MKILTSYFYQVRFFKPNMIPMSTAVWDPKWYHDNKGPQYAYRDKNNVIVGLRASPFVPGSQCDGLCRGVENCSTKDPKTCEFLQQYRAQLDLLNFNEIISGLESFSRIIAKDFNIEEEPVIVLLFHETPDNLCSERKVVQAWFKDHGMEITEFIHDK